ncbi:MAG: hypothetical protein JOZ58_28095 [Acetobacteraceae bacterium]|nr:hypothetical protein [Acetobacteraceae bacterium]
MAQLNIDIICANIPQAKGRVERAFGVLQDRLVSCGWPASPASRRRTHGCPGSSPTTIGASAATRRTPRTCIGPLASADDLDETLAWREQRTVTHNLTLHYYDRMMLILDPTPLTRTLARRTVEVVNHPDGRFAVRHMGTDLAAHRQCRRAARLTMALRPTHHSRHTNRNPRSRGTATSPAVTAATTRTRKSRE